MCRFLHVKFYCSQPRHGRIPYMDHPDTLDESETLRLANKLVLEQKGHMPCEHGNCLPHEMTEEPVLLVADEGRCQACAVEVAERKIREPEWEAWYRSVSTRGGAEYKPPVAGAPLNADAVKLASWYIMREQGKSLAETYLQIPPPEAAAADDDKGDDSEQTMVDGIPEKGPALSKVGILARLAGRNLHPRRFRRSLWGVFAIHDGHISCYCSGMVFPFTPSIYGLDRIQE
ncbi:hypothetical protein BJ166DRAFT_613683 [Pestalotiopsis sp. NC0098]|nr:hypothetical protein BJ166DRAFT_613683 [Pestalotiopsis sp. NC0098]